MGAHGCRFGSGKGFDNETNLGLGRRAHVLAYGAWWFPYHLPRGDSKTLRPRCWERARDSWCLHKFIRGQGGNRMELCLVMEMVSKMLDWSSRLQMGWVGPQSWREWSDVYECTSVSSNVKVLR